MRGGLGIAGRTGLTDDVAQETFLKAWRRIPTRRDPAKLKAWLTPIAHDCALGALRREDPHAVPNNSGFGGRAPAYWPGFSRTAPPPTWRRRRRWCGPHWRRCRRI
ncbi:MAG: hypothetical protein EOP86_27370 [Verrucomicrobiaceae bacterium]|nr:MAG: hypothetical protein EOP86_27370 [Verrucomicrobiaceae bacterium]